MKKSFNAQVFVCFLFFSFVFLITTSKAHAETLGDPGYPTSIVTSFLNASPAIDKNGIAQNQPGAQSTGKNPVGYTGSNPFILGYTGRSWNNAEKFWMRNVSSSTIEVLVVVDCWKEWEVVTCNDRVYTIKVSPGETISDGLGYICAKWQTDFYFKYEGTDYVWGATAEKDADTCSSKEIEILDGGWSIECSYEPKKIFRKVKVYKKGTIKATTRVADPPSVRTNDVAIPGFESYPVNAGDVVVLPINFPGFKIMPNSEWNNGTTLNFHLGVTLYLDNNAGFFSAGHDIDASKDFGCKHDPSDNLTDITGKVWEIQKGNDCSTPTSQRTNINATGASKVKKSDTEDSSITSGKYSLKGVSVTNPDNTLCANSIKPNPSIWGPTSFYKLSCVDGTLNNDPYSVNCVNLGNLDASKDYTVNLGFEVVSRGWFHVLNGDVYSGCTDCFSGAIISLVPPQKATNPYSSKALYLIDSSSTPKQSSGLAMARGDIVVRDTNGDVKISSGSFNSNNYNVKNYSNTKINWSALKSLTEFTPPTNAKNVSDCSTFFTANHPSNEVYKMSASCFNIATLTDKTYRFSGDGAAVVYISSINDITLSKKLQKLASSKASLILIFNNYLIVDSSLGAVSPALSNLTPQIEATIITKDGVLIDCNRTGGVCDQTDTTFVLKGSILTKQSVSLNRIRSKETANYPSEVVEFSPENLVRLNNLLINGNNSGLHIQKVTWQTK